MRGAKRKMIREASSVGVVLGDPQIGLMIEQPVQDMRSIADRVGNDLGVKGRVLIGNVRVESHAWVVAILRVDLARRFASARQRGTAGRRRKRLCPRPNARRMATGDDD